MRGPGEGTQFHGKCISAATLYVPYASGELLGKLNKVAVLSLSKDYVTTNIEGGQRPWGTLGQPSTTWLENLEAAWNPTAAEETQDDLQVAPVPAICDST